MIELFMIALIGVLAYIAFNLDDVHVALKIGLMLFIFGLIPLSFSVTANIVTMEYGNGTVPTLVSGSLHRIGGWLTYVTWMIFAYFVIFIIWSIMSWAKNTAQNDESENKATIEQEGKGDMKW